ncbi:hypothetical protein BLOT_009208 [Blomia tropicalis]|nr:hypothetical protein BLOT_009208 [Blomia tropicalis]
MTTLTRSDITQNNSVEVPLNNDGSELSYSGIHHQSVIFKALHNRSNWLQGTNDVDVDDIEDFPSFRSLCFLSLNYGRVKFAASIGRRAMMPKVGKSHKT